MKEALISFETSEIAKSKGFAFVWEDYESESLELGRHRWCSYYKDSSKIEALPINWLETNHSAEQWNELDLDCPTQSLLQKWLRETHGIHIIIDCTPNAGEYRVCVFTIKGGVYQNIDNRFETYEQALEAGLTEALKLIP